ncbi:class I SAM-dependent methyltransferase [Dactylosporangium salmoneum]|uniref:Class I SAM-dependent methyltransferase n=1 Tax=Dactylosporangium salmoneum TaxID=53361 RepID=A0ABP5TUV8_9ACTN
MSTTGNLEKADFERERKTLLVSLHAKALDCAAAKPVLGDRSAAAAAQRLDYDYAQLRVRTDDAIAMVIRAKQLDDWTAQFLAAHPAATVLHLGCGLDRRCDRVERPGTPTWFDVDFPDVVALAQRLYPAAEGQRYVGADVTDGDWLDAIPASGEVIVVAEGLTMLLTEAEMRALVERIGRKFGHGEYIFDVYNTIAIRSMNRHQTIQATGAELCWGVDDINDVTAWAPGLRLEQEWFIVGSPYVGRMPFTSILISRLMHLSPKLRRFSRLVRISF